MKVGSAKPQQSYFRINSNVIALVLVKTQSRVGEIIDQEIALSLVQDQYDNYRFSLSKYKEFIIKTVKALLWSTIRVIPIPHSIIT